MSYNPPDLKYEMKDHLFCLGLDYKYERINTPKGHVWSFFIPSIDRYIDVYGPYFIKFDKKVYKSLYEMKCELINRFRHLV